MGEPRNDTWSYVFGPLLIVIYPDLRGHVAKGSQIYVSSSDLASPPHLL